MTLQAIPQQAPAHAGASPSIGNHSTGGHSAGNNSLAADDSSAPLSELSERDLAILAFERTWWKFGAAKEQAVLEQFDLTAVRYYQILNALIDQPAALAADPLLVKRLRRLRTTRRQGRTTRHLSHENASLTG